MRFPRRYVTLSSDTHRFAVIGQGTVMETRHGNGGTEEHPCRAEALKGAVSITEAFKHADSCVLQFVLPSLESSAVLLFSFSRLRKALSQPIVSRVLRFPERLGHTIGLTFLCGDCSRKFDPI